MLLKLSAALLALCACGARAESPALQVECDAFAGPALGIQCVDGPTGRVVAEGFDFRAGAWYWNDERMPGDCPADDSCMIVWSDELEQPVLVLAPDPR